MKTATISKKAGSLIAEKIADLLKEAEDVRKLYNQSDAFKYGYTYQGLQHLKEELASGFICKLEDKDKEQISKI